MTKQILASTALGIILGLSSNASAVTTILGALDNPDNFDQTIMSTYIDYNFVDLDSWEYEVRLPAGFDTNKTYGLISYTDSGTAGTAPAAWKQALDEHDLIWVGARTNGNTGPGGARRRGIAIMGSFRMTELYNIDTNRMYACGNSGGSRSAASQVILRPDLFRGVINNVGSTFVHDLPEKFTTTVDYEYANLTTIPLSSRWEDRRHFDSTTRWVTLTAYTDFRTDELMNIYHLGHINFGNTAKLLSRSGGHSYKEYQDFNDAINFIEHPLITVIEDHFSDTNIVTNSDNGRGFSDLSDTGASIIESAYTFNGTNLVSMKLNTTNTAAAIAEANDRFSWHDPYGIILNARMRSEDTGLYNQQLGLHILRDDADNTTRTGFNLLIQQTDHTNKHVQCVLTDTNGADTILFEFDFDGLNEPLDRLSTADDYFGLSEMPQYVGKSEAFRGLDIRIQLWDQAIQFTFGQDIDASSFTATSTPTPVRLMDDRRIVQAYFSEVGITNDIQNLISDPDLWKLWFSNKALSPAPADAALVDDVKLIAAKGALHKLVINSEHGSPTPPMGTSILTLNTVVTNWVDSVIINTNLFKPIGWALSGNSPASGSTNNFTMTITNNAVLTWLWKTSSVIGYVSASTNVMEDVYVRNNDTNNFGFDSGIHVSDYTSEQGFLKFIVTNINWTLVNSVTLRMRAADNITNTAVYAVNDTSWQEGTINGTNEPLLMVMLDSVSNIIADTWYDFDVSAHITANGTWALGLNESRPPATTMLINGDFETPQSEVSQLISTSGNWVQTGAIGQQCIQQAGWATESGTQGVRLRAYSPNLDHIFYQDVSGSSGIEYTFDAGLKFGSSFESNGSTLDMAIIWLNESNVEISRETLNVVLNADNIFAHQKITAIAPISTSTIRVQFHWTTDDTIENSTQTSTMIDNVTLTSTPTNSFNWYSRESGFAPQLIFNIGVLADEDSDFDGMLDGFEMNYFGNLDENGNGDADGDGFINLHEYKAHTNPTNNSSYLHISAIKSITDNKIEFTWPSADDVQYKILYRTNLLEGAWITNQAGISGISPLNITTAVVNDASGYFILNVE